MFRIVTPRTEQELARYYDFRYRMLREPWHARVVQSAMRMMLMRAIV